MEGLGLFTGSLVVPSAFAEVNLVYETSFLEQHDCFFSEQTSSFSEQTRFRKKTSAFSEKPERVFGKGAHVSYTNLDPRERARNDERTR